jgi:hypothetical protein
MGPGIISKVRSFISLALSMDYDIFMPSHGSGRGG